MKFMFETSLGMCYGFNNDDNISFTDASCKILNKLYELNSYNGAEHKIDHKWLKLELSDPYYGSPEYKIVYID